MPAKKESQAVRQNSRRKSLRYHSDQAKPEIPAYLKAVSASEEEEAISSASTDVEPQPKSRTITSSNHEGTITITMNRASIFSVILGIALASLCFFGLGFLTAQLYGPAALIQKSTIPQAHEAEAAPEIPQSADNSDEKGKLVELAQNLSGQFSKEKLPGADTVEKTSETLSGVKQAQDIVDKTKENITKAIPTGGAQQTTSATPRTNKATTIGDKGNYAISLGEPTSEEQAKLMQEEAKKAKIETYVLPVPNTGPRPTYALLTGRFESYSDATSAIEGLPKPFSLWGKVYKIDSNRPSNQGDN